MSIRNLIVAAIVLLAQPAHAQADPKNPEHQFRAFAALAGAGKRCGVSETLDERIAQQFGDQMMGANNDAARTVFDTTYNQARQTDCSDPTLVQLFAIALPAAIKAADGVALAYLDQGFCKANINAGAMRLYATYRQAGMSAKRKTDAAATRSDWGQALKTGCASDAAGFSDSYPQAIMVWDFTPNLDGSCQSDWGKKAGPFDCVYGKRPQGPSSYDDTIRFARQSIRAAKAKAAALQIDKTRTCHFFSGVELAVGDAQMKEDARLGLKHFSTSLKALSSDFDPEPTYATTEDVLAAGREVKGACTDLREGPPALPANAPNTVKGEQVTPGSGAVRIRETVDRVAMVAASLPNCAALPNFPATRKAAATYVAGMTAYRRLVAAAEATPLMLELDKTQCDLIKLGDAFQATALFAADALKGNWK